MCRALHTNFFHKCGHEQFVETPSINPTCQKAWKSFRYMENAYCGRCTWTGRLLPFVYPREWKEPGPAIQCREGQTGEVIRTVRMPWYKKYNYTTETLWNERRRQWKIHYDIWHLQQEKAWAALQKSAEWLALPPIGRSYFIRVPRYGDVVNAPEFYWHAGNLDFLKERDVTICPICHGNINLGVNHPDSCVGSDFMDVAGNRIYGYPVGLPCNHFFGLGCIRLWIEGNGEVAPSHDNCPMCNTVFNLLREDAFSEPQHWPTQHAWDLTPISAKILYIPRQNYRRVEVWYQEVRDHVARIQQWQQILQSDIQHLPDLAHTLLDYCTFLILNSVCLCHPFWMSTTNIILATLGTIVFWWTRIRPLNFIQDETRSRFKLYFWFSFLGNFLEWGIEREAQGWFTQTGDYIWAFIYLNYFGFLLRNMR